MLTAGTVLMAVALVATVWFSLTVTTQHFSLGWPTHAQHHLVSEIATTIGMCVICFFLLFVPLRDRESWSLVALLVAGLAIYGSYWLGNLTVGLGEVEAKVRNAAWAIESALFAIGLALAWVAI